MRVLSDSEYNEARQKAGWIGLRVCPTCLDVGTYKYWGEHYACDCARQKELWKHYLLANIGPEYQRLSWERDYTYSDKVKELVQSYLDKWQSCKLNGMGIEFFGKDLGVGKTFAATYVARELIKRDEKVYFIPFLDVISLYSESNAEELKHKLKSITVLVVDEIGAPMSQAQHNLYAHKFEELIRHRTNFNLPTIITTNLSQEELEYYYPRTYSLLSAKQLRIEMSGADARQKRVAEENLELVMNDEVRPLS